MGTGNKRISELPSAAGAADYQQFPINDAGITRRLTVAQLAAFIGGGGGGGGATYTAENKSGAAQGAGAIVAVHSSGVGITTARADNAGTLAIGMLTEATLAGVAGSVQTEGVITLGDWTIATGGATLVGGAIYYLSTTIAGRITSTPPSSGYVQRAGRAVNSTTLDISINEGILL